MANIDESESQIQSGTTSVASIPGWTRHTIAFLLAKSAALPSLEFFETSFVFLLALMPDFGTSTWEGFFCAWSISGAISS